MGKDVKDYDWHEVRDALYAFAAHLEATEPHAKNTIALFTNAADKCPHPEDFQ